MNKILIVNDTPIVNKFIKHSLEEEGFSVDAVMTGQEGITKAKENPYDIILLDYHLPDVNGDVVCATIKADAHIAKTPVYYISSLDKEKMEQVIIQTGAQGFLDITVDIDELCDKIKELVRS
ncbi:MAG: response regulator [Candidatus Omnitrophica bacterium]|nr:response regulator [Candidatus Omnitrophota bacterium]